MEGINETFGSNNITAFFIWNIFFFVYGVAITMPLLTFLCLIMSFIIVGISAIRFLERKNRKTPSQEQNSNYFGDVQEGITTSIHSIVNNTVSWVAKIITNFDLIEIMVALVTLYFVDLFCFYSSDGLIIYALGNLLILLKGLVEVAKPHVQNFLELKQAIREKMSSLLSKKASSQPKTQ